MAFKFKNYAFAATAMMGVYSAQLMVGFLPSDDAVRTIAQVEAQVVLSAENVMAEIEKQSQAITARLEKHESFKAKIEELSKVKELKKLEAQHSKLVQDSVESHDLFKKNVEAFVAAQSEEFDRSAIEEAMANLDEKQFNLTVSFASFKVEDAIAVARDNEAEQRDSKISELQGLLCEQRQNIADLKDELSKKLSEITDLISSKKEEQATTALASSEFELPWAQMQSPFSQFFNPFSFLSGGLSQFSSIPGMGQQMSFGMGMSNGYTQNNFYGPTSFNAYSFMLPKMQMPMREPSQIQTHQPPADLMIPSVDRGTGISSEAVIF